MSKPIIAPSLLSANFLNLREDLDNINRSEADWLHVDIMDGVFVKNKTMPWSEMKNIYKYTDKRLDVHLMVSDPTKYIKNYSSLNTEYITIHSEIPGDITSYIRLIKSYNIKAGIAIKPNTNIRDIIPYLPYVDLILVMSVEPGFGGQSFMENSLDKIAELRQLIDENHYECVIQVDGGINQETAKKSESCRL